jgi:hypothetical protein
VSINDIVGGDVFSGGEKSGGIILV